MKKTVIVVGVCSLLLVPNCVYATNTEMEEVNNKLSRNREEQSNIDIQIKDLDIKIISMEEKISETVKKLSELDIEIATTQEEIGIIKKDIASSEMSLGKRLKVINNNYTMGYMKVILSSDSLSDFFHYSYIIKKVVEQDKKILKELKENKTLVEKKELDLKNKKEEQESLKDALDKDNNILKEDKSKLEALKKEMEEEEANLEKELERLALESAAKLESAANYNFDLSGVVISDGAWPIPGYSRISSPYGYRIHPILKTRKMHTGIDIPAPKGTPVVAIDGGTVITSGVKGSYGYTIMIQHDDGKVSLYAHNSELVAVEGQRVEKGEIVAKVGSTGRSTGPHSHFEIRINGKHVDPVPFLMGDANNTNSDSNNNNANSDNADSSDANDNTNETETNKEQ